MTTYHIDYKSDRKAKAWKRFHFEFNTVDGAESSAISHLMQYKWHSFRVVSSDAPDDEITGATEHDFADDKPHRTVTRALTAGIRRTLGGDFPVSKAELKFVDWPY